MLWGYAATASDELRAGSRQSPRVHEERPRRRIRKAGSPAY
jgi:hypothetical protein